MAFATAGYFGGASSGSRVSVRATGARPAAAAQIGPVRGTGRLARSSTAVRTATAAGQGTPMRPSSQGALANIGKVVRL
jgi:hypothetical protein